MTAARALLLTLALAGCMPELAASTTPGEGWPDLADPPNGRLDGRRDAALIVVIDDPALDGRPGGWQVGSGWWRYLVRTRGLRPRRVQMLRNQAATVDAITDAVERMENQADTGSMLWLIYIGGGSSPIDGSDGRLRAGDGRTLEFAPVREQLSAGYHESAFVLLDACETPSKSAWRSGVPATPPLPPPPPPPPPFELGVEHAITGSSFGDAVARTKARVRHDVVLERAKLRNTFVLTAGTEDRCATSLADRPWPALAYAVLGGLQGWSDLDEDGWIAGRELAIYAQALIAGLDAAPDAPPNIRLEAGGVDLILADVAGFAPHPARVAWRRRDATPLDPGIAGPTDESLARAATQVALDLEDMVAVPGGDFFMGCDRDNDDACERDEYPPHNVMLGRFAIDRTEVTWAQYRACQAGGACEPIRLESCWVWDGDAFLRGAELPAPMLAEDHPAVCVSWSEAASYCAAVGKRLPTEAEWERAARGVDGRLYPWGNDEPSCQTTAMHGCSEFTRAVGSHPRGASPVGALDMAGNVAEWVHDWWDEHGYGRVIPPNPTGPAAGQVRSVRGGSFYSNESDLRVSYRYGLDPLARLSIVGFRCAR